MRFVKDIENNTLIGYKYFDFTGSTRLSVKHRGNGGELKVMTEAEKPLTTIQLKPSVEWTESETIIFNVNGKLPLYLEYTGKGKIDLLTNNF